jgi:type IV pilus assembly protein PilA
VCYENEQSFCPTDGTALIESQDLQPGGFRFSCLGGMEDTVPSSEARRFQRVLWILAGSLGACLIAFILLILRVGYMVNPSYELSAMNSVRAIHEAELQYASSYPGVGYACSLSALGGDPKSGPPSPAAAQILYDDLASGTKYGYLFKIRNCTRKTINGIDVVAGYTVLAVPLVVSKHRHRGFCSDETGVLKVDPKGGANCTLSLTQ